MPFPVSFCNYRSHGFFFETLHPKSIPAHPHTGCFDFSSMQEHNLPVFSLFFPLLQSVFPLHQSLRSGLLSGSYPTILESLRFHCFFLQQLFVQDKNHPLYSTRIQCELPFQLPFYWNAWFFHQYRWFFSAALHHPDLIGPAIFHRVVVRFLVISSP